MPVSIFFCYERSDKELLEKLKTRFGLLRWQGLIEEWDDGDISAGTAWGNEQTLVSAGSTDKTIKVWDLSTGKATRTLTGHTGTVTSVAMSADGQILVSASLDETIKVWNLATGREVQTLTGHTGYVYSVAMSADGKTLVSGSGDTTIKVWGV